MEKFKKVDIDHYEEQHNLMKNSYRPALDLTMDPEVAHIELPEQVMCSLIHTRRPEYIDYLPYKVHVMAFTEETEWSKGSSYLGLNDNVNGTLDIWLRPKRKYNACELLWLLLHEFRHKIQRREKSIRTCTVSNKNIKMWLKNCGESENMTMHVLHEILPFEVDANTFACELMNIEYPGSKFDITPRRLDLLGKKLEKGLNLG